MYLTICWKCSSCLGQWWTYYWILSSLMKKWYWVVLGVLIGRIWLDHLLVDKACFHLKRGWINSSYWVTNKIIIWKYMNRGREREREWSGQGFNVLQYFKSSNPNCIKVESLIAHSFSFPSCMFYYISKIIQNTKHFLVNIPNIIYVFIWRTLC